MKNNYHVLLFTILYLHIFMKSGVCLLYKNDNKKPFTMNVTYQNPTEDYTERKKYVEEEIALKRRIGELEQKINADSDLLKMILNINNIQIQKLSEIINVNQATLYYKALHFTPMKKHKIKQKKCKYPSVNMNNSKSVERFIHIMTNLGLLPKEACELTPTQKLIDGSKTDKNYYQARIQKYLKDWMKKRDTSKAKHEKEEPC